MSLDGWVEQTKKTPGDQSQGEVTTAEQAVL